MQSNSKTTNHQNGNKQSRYEQVKALLELASGEAPVDYDGKGRFWNLPYDEFLTVSIYGVRMIAPVPNDAGASVVCDSDRPAGVRTLNGDNTGGCSHCDTEDVAQSDDNNRFSDCYESVPPSSPGPNTSLPVHPGRGAASGLIKGLRGEHPFNGRHLPRLPWGAATPMGNSEILFIQDWIDDGCPKSDSASASPGNESCCHPSDAASTDTSAPVPPISATPRVANSQDFKTQRNEAIQRKNVEFLTDDELCKLRYAIQWMKSLNPHNNFNPSQGIRQFDRRSYDNWARIHADTCPHGWELFLPWHRMFLYDFEQALRDIVPDVALMYWDWTMPRYKNGSTGAIPQAFKGWLDEQALSQLEKTIQTPGLMDKLNAIKDQKFDSINRLLLVANGQGEEVPNGTQTDRITRFRKFVASFRSPDAGPNDYDHIVKAMEAVNPLWSSKRWPNEFYWANDLQHFQHHYPLADDISNIITNINNFRDFGGGTVIDQSFGALDMNAHNTGHIWSGGYDLYYPKAQQVNGDMLANLTAAWDPIFWGHHGNVDRIWNLWQEQHPGLGPDDPTAALAPFTYRVSDSANISKLGYEYVTQSVVFQSNRNVPMSRYQTDPNDLPMRMLGESCQAVEIRIHDFVQPNDSCFIRVFLNQPGADATTHTQNNPNFVGQIPIFGHGPCVGGPGHCDAPAIKTRRHDLRQPDHNTPWNFRLDGNTCIKHLREHGAENIQINMVCVATDGREAPELLRFDAVSLNFKES